MIVLALLHFALRTAEKEKITSFSRNQGPGPP